MRLKKVWLTNFFFDFKSFCMDIATTYTETLVLRPMMVYYLL